MTDREAAFCYWLFTVPGLSGQIGWKLYDRCGNAETVYDASERKLQSILTSEQVASVLQHKKIWDVWGKYEEMRRTGIQLVVKGDTGYPDRLVPLNGAPSVLYYKGRLPENRVASVAIVGTRRCNDYGRIAAKKFGMELAHRGVQVISGLAMGIDGISQLAAIREGGASFAVLGCGVDICYPARNRDIYEALLDKGGIISEYPPGTRPQNFMFPARNRIISGLSDLVLVVQAGEKSGTLITADMALEQGKDVMAIPGRLWDPLSAGCLNLIKQGAGMATCVEDILEALSVGSSLPMENYNQMTLFNMEELSAEEARIYELMDLDPVAIETLVEKCELPLETIMNQVISLCLKGYIVPKSSGTYCISEKMFLQGKKK